MTASGHHDIASTPEQAAVEVEVAPVEVDDAHTPSFVEGFAPVEAGQWQELVAKVVNRGRQPERQVDGPAAVESLRTHTVDGLDIDPLYTPGDEQPPLGRPGVMPFTRGRTALRAEPAWDVRQLHDDPDAQTSHDAVMTDLERGVTSLWLVVGDDGIAAADLPTVLSDVQLDLAPVVVGSRTDPDTAATALADLWSERGVSAQAAGGFGLDPLGLVAVRGGTPDFTALRAWGERARRDFPRATVAVADTLPYNEAGAADVDELGCAVATGLAYVRELVDAGLDVTAAFGAVEFRLAVSDDQFLSTAKVRALRRMWARVAEVCEAPEAERGARTHAVTSRRMTSRDDPYVNVLRSTIACFGAAVGGADAITVLPFDDAVGLPDAFSRRIARNTQILLAEESSLARVIDPAGGSWYVESLTDELARAAWAWFQQIEAAGGMAAALRDGVVHERLAQVRARTDERLATGSQPLTGVSTFPDLAATPLTRRPRTPLPPVAGEVEPLPRRRDAEVFERLRDRSQAAAEAGSTPTVVLACLGARRDYGARETFTASFLAAGGIASVPVELDSASVPGGTAAAVLCSSPALNAERGAAAVQALRDAGVGTVYLAGRPREVGETAHLDGAVGQGSDAVTVLGDLLDVLGAPAADPLPTADDPTPQGAGA